MAKEHNTNLFKKHIFICKSCKVNDKCMGQEAVELKKSLKGHFNELYGKGVYRVSTSDCLGKCKEGIHIVSYPEAKWFKNGTRESFEAICNYVKSSS